MKIYLVTTTLAVTWDCAEGFVVRAAHVDDAKLLTMGHWGNISPTANELEVVCVGDAPPTAPGGVVLRSFNGG